MNPDKQAVTDALMEVPADYVAALAFLSNKGISLDACGRAGDNCPMHDYIRAVFPSIDDVWVAKHYASYWTGQTYWGRVELPGHIQEFIDTWDSVK